MAHDAHRLADPGAWVRYHPLVVTTTLLTGTVIGIRTVNRLRRPVREDRRPDRPSSDRASRSRSGECSISPPITREHRVRWISVAIVQALGRALLGILVTKAVQARRRTSSAAADL